MKILAIGSHPDDIECGCFGTLKKYKQKGAELYYLMLTCGGDSGDAEVRRTEQLESAEVLGAKVIFTNLESAYLNNDSGRKTIEAIEKAIKEVKPDIIFTHSEHDRHQDHRLVNRATNSACRFFQGELYYYCGYSSLKDFKPQVYEKIEDDTEPLKFFKSQSDKFYMNPKVRDSILVFWATQAGFLGKAEAFEVGRIIR